jgi:DNA gyrase inhibitor GyrI
MPISVEIAIETLAPFRVACTQVISPTPEQDARQRLKDWLSTQRVVSSTRHFGFAIDVPDAQHKLGQRGYEAWATIPDTISPCDGVRIRHFEGGVYATLQLHQPMDDSVDAIISGWKCLHQWVIESDAYRSANHQWLEEIVPFSDGKILKLYHPIQHPEYPE